jgi:hypothetical protein
MCFIQLKHAQIKFPLCSFWTVGGRGANSYDHEKAWPSINIQYYLGCYISALIKITESICFAACTRKCARKICAKQ